MSDDWTCLCEPWHPTSNLTEWWLNSGLGEPWRPTSNLTEQWLNSGLYEPWCPTSNLTKQWLWHIQHWSQVAFILYNSCQQSCVFIHLQFGFAPAEQKDKKTSEWQGEWGSTPNVYTSNCQPPPTPHPPIGCKAVNNQTNYRQTSWQRKETMNKTKPADKPSIHSKSTRQVTSKPPCQLSSFLLGYIKCNPLPPPPTPKKPNNRGWNWKRTSLKNIK